MANLKLKNPAGGSLNFVSADGASDLTVTFPATTGTAMVSGNMPAFSAYASATQSVSTTTFTKVVFDVERFDTNSNFASSTFTPTVAGYYQISHAMYLGGAASGSTFTYLYKNGTNYAGLTRIANSNAVNLLNSVSCLVYCNGTTDYLEIYIYQNSGGTVTEGNGDPSGCWFTGAMVRSA